MKTESPTLVALVLLVAGTALSNGCAAKRFSQYTGRQQAWPTSPGALAEHSYAVPVYRGWPEKPYRVIGSIRFADPNAEWKDGDTAHAAGMAKRSGGDAMIIRYGGEFGASAVVGAADDPKVWTIQNQLTALVIKWKTAEEVGEEDAAVQKFKSDFSLKHPQLAHKSDVVESAIDYLQWLGLNLNSEQAEQKMREILSQLDAANRADSSSKWLFKGTIRSSSLTTSSTSPVYGIATVSFKDGNASIVSAGGEVELNFNGTSKDGRLAGQLGLSFRSIIVSSRAEGALLGDKLSLTSQTQTPDGTFQGSFSFIH